MDVSGGKRIVVERKQPAFSQEQRVGLGLVIGIGSLALIMGLIYVGSHLTRAFETGYEGPLVLTEEQKQAQALAELQGKDTDEDGLTDYEELYLYRTSPYIADSDSDGLDDTTEIQQGTDPNCATGADCDAFEQSAVGTSPYDPNLEVVGSGLEAIEQANEGLDLIDELLNSTSAVQVRSFLIDNGVSEETVSGYTDAQVMQLYEETLKEMEANGQLEALLEESE